MYEIYVMDCVSNLRNLNTCVTQLPNISSTQYIKFPQQAKHYAQQGEDNRHSWFQKQKMLIQLITTFPLGMTEKNFDAVMIRQDI